MPASSKEARWTLLFLLVAVSAVQAGQFPSSVVRNLARGSALKMMADLSGALPMEIWKSSVVLESIRSKQEKRRSRTSKRVLQDLVQERGVQGLWTGCSARMVEGFFSGAVLLAGKEGIKRSLLATPIVTKTLSPGIIGFVAGAGGGAAQALVMAPTSFLVTSTTKSGQSVVEAAKDAWKKEGMRGIYTGSAAVAARQATNWASRQGFTEIVRPKINIAGVPGEIIAGCLGGALSCWNTPFEICRIHSQSRSFMGDKRDNDNPPSLFGTMNQIRQEDGIGGLYVGLTPRIFQACYQTVFLVCIPRLL